MSVMVCPRWANNSKDSPKEPTAPAAHDAPQAPKTIIDAVIRRFARNGHVVHMALTHARAGHAHEHGRGAHLVDVPATGVTHARAQTAHELVDDGDHRALVRHASLDALRHELLDLDLAFLEVAVAGAALHGTECAHAAIGFVRAALIQLDLAGRLLRAREHAAHHHAIGARDDGLGEVARIAHTAVGDHGHAAFGQGLGDVRDRSDLRHALTAHDARGADRAGADTDLHRVDTGLDQCERAFGRRDVAADDLHLGKVLLDPFDTVEHALRMAVGGVDHDYVDLGRDQRGDAVVGALARANRGTDAQAFVIVFRGIGFFTRLLDVFHRHHAAQLKSVVHHQQLFDAMLMQQALDLVAARALLHRHQPLLGRHHLGDGVVVTGLETQVAVGDDADEVLALHHGHARDVVLAGEFQDAANGGVGRHGNGLFDDACLVFLDPPHLLGLLVGRHILVDDADASLLREGDGEARLGHRIHSGGHQRDVERYLPREPGLELHLARQHRRVGRYQQHIVKGQRFFDYSQHGGAPSLSD